MDNIVSETFFEENCMDSGGHQYIYSIYFVVWIIVMILQTIWCWGTYGLWVDANRKSRTYQSGVRMGPLKATLEFHNALEEQLSQSESTSLDTENQIWKHLGSKSEVGYCQKVKGSDESFLLCSRREIDEDSMS